MEIEGKEEIVGEAKDKSESMIEAIVNIYLIDFCYVIALSFELETIATRLYSCLDLLEILLPIALLSFESKPLEIHALIAFTTYITGHSKFTSHPLLIRWKKKRL